MMKGLRHESCEAYVILWQSYVWLGYELNEEIVIGGSVLDKSGKKKAWLISVGRVPYAKSRYEWVVNWQPTFVEATGKNVVYDWMIFEKENIQEVGAVLKWCQEKHFLERVEEFGTPLLQRWVFIDNWMRLLERGLTSEELKVLKEVKLNPPIELPLGKQ